jgi:hypothetical protein
MVVDLQGVNGILTDPQIHSKGSAGTRFGAGNLGIDGMAAFFSGHKCNHICEALELSPMSSGSATIRRRADRLRDADEGLIAEKDALREMEISCGLCGEIFQILQTQYVEYTRKGRESHCKDCATKTSIQETASCRVCEEKYQYSPFWYRMRGMEAPKTCKTCKAKAAATKGS